LKVLQVQYLSRFSVVRHVVYSQILQLQPHSYSIEYYTHQMTLHQCVRDISFCRSMYYICSYCCDLYSL